jgi:hypothetical protein
MTMLAAQSAMSRGAFHAPYSYSSYSIAWRMWVETKSRNYRKKLVNRWRLSYA